MLGGRLRQGHYEPVGGGDKAAEQGKKVRPESQPEGAQRRRGDHVQSQQHYGELDGAAGRRLHRQSLKHAWQGQAQGQVAQQQLQHCAYAQSQLLRAHEGPVVAAGSCRRQLRTQLLLAVAHGAGGDAAVGAPYAQKGGGKQRGQILLEAGQVPCLVKVILQAVGAAWGAVLLVVVVFQGIVSRGSAVVPEALGIGVLFLLFRGKSVILGAVAFRLLLLCFLLGLAALFEYAPLALKFLRVVVLLTAVPVVFRRPVGEVVVGLGGGSVALVGAHVHRTAAELIAAALPVAAEIEAAVYFRIIGGVPGLLRLPGPGQLILPKGGIEFLLGQRSPAGAGLGHLHMGDIFPGLPLHSTYVAAAGAGALGISVILTAP